MLRLRSFLILAVATGSSVALSGCLTRQTWNHSTVKDIPATVDIKDVGSYTPEYTVPYGAGGVAWRSVTTPFAMAADGGIVLFLFISDMAGGHKSIPSTGEWMMRKVPEGVAKTTDKMEFSNVPSEFLAYVNRELKDENGRSITFISRPQDKTMISVEGFTSSDGGAPFISNVDRSAKKFSFSTNYGKNYFFDDQDNSDPKQAAVANFTVEVVSNGLMITGKANYFDKKHVFHERAVIPAGTFKTVGPVR